MSTEQARTEYLADSPFWAAELITRLEGLASGSGLLWATESVIELTKEVAPVHKDNFLDWVREITALAATLAKEAAKLACASPPYLASGRH